MAEHPTKTAAASSQRPDALTDSTLYPKHYSSHMDQRNAAFFGHPTIKSHFVAQSLLYETLVIPTNDFGIVAAAIDWMGDGAFEDALDSEALTFLRRRGFLAYASDGLGIQEMAIEDTPEKPFDWWQKAFFADMSQSIDIQLIHRHPGLTGRRREHLIEKVIRYTDVVVYPGNDYFINNIAKESYYDARDTPELRAEIIRFAHAVGHPRGAPIDMMRLPGVSKNSFQIVGSAEVTSAPDLVIRIAEMNMDLFLAGFGGGTDVYVPRGADAVIKQKLARAGYPEARREGFLKILALTNLPDIRPAVESGAIAFDSIWKVRQSRKARRFREWLAQADPASADDLVRLYIESIEQPSVIESVPARIVRFGLLTALGLSHPVAGGALALADTLFTEKFIKGYRPKLMFNQLEKLFPGGPSAS
jgi:hypothetical protein